MSSVAKPQRRAAAGQKTTCPAASPQARRMAAAILEVLAGVRRPSEAAVVLATSLPRYYQLEQRALAGLLAACEPVPRGRQQDASRRVTVLERENRRLKRECDRQQALVRATQRALGLATPAAAKPSSGKPTSQGAEEKAGGSSGKRRRTRRPTVRALKAARSLQAQEEAAAPTEPTETAVAITPVAN